MNSLNIDFFGNILPCCSIYADFKPLPAIAEVSEDLEVINDKRLVYYGLIYNFQEAYKRVEERKKRDFKIYENCLFCVNEFPKYLNNILVNLKKE